MSAVSAATRMDSWTDDVASSPDNASSVVHVIPRDRGDGVFVGPTFLGKVQYDEGVSLVPRHPLPMTIRSIVNDNVEMVVIEHEDLPIFGLGDTVEEAWESLHEVIVLQWSRLVERHEEHQLAPGARRTRRHLMTMFVVDRESA